MTHKTISDWPWGRGSNPDDGDIPDWLVNALIWGIGFAVCGGAVYSFVKNPPCEQTLKSQKPKIENVVQKQTIIKNDTLYITMSQGIVYSR